MRNDGSVPTFGGVVMERYDRTMSVLSLWLPLGHTDRGGEEESGWIQTAAGDGDA